MSPAGQLYSGTPLPQRREGNCKALVTKTEAGRDLGTMKSDMPSVLCIGWVFHTGGRKSVVK